MSKLHVLGIGSPFGDDQAGWEVVKLLQQRLTSYNFSPEQLTILCCDRPGMQLLELMQPAQIVLLIDAVKTGAEIGTIHRFQNEEIANLHETLSTHALGVAAAMEMGAILQTLPPKVILYGIEIGEIPFQFSVSEPIMQAITKLSLLMEHDILTLLNIQNMKQS